MPRHNEDDWSDSDGESNNAEVETSVLLGIPDGDIDSSVDISDPSVSRIGGHPVTCFSISEPPNAYLTYRRFFLACLLTLPVLTVEYAQSLCHCLFRCGVLLKAALWIGLFTFGVVKVRLASTKVAGEVSISPLVLFLCSCRYPLAWAPMIIQYDVPSRTIYIHHTI
jgi:pre-rRNA-processing protein TSR4